MPKYVTTSSKKKTTVAPRRQKIERKPIKTTRDAIPINATTATTQKISTTTTTTTTAFVTTRTTAVATTEFVSSFVIPGKETIGIGTFEKTEVTTLPKKNLGRIAKEIVGTFEKPEIETSQKTNVKITTEKIDTTKPKTIKVYQLFKPVKELSKRMTSTDCGDKECSLRHQFLKDCYLYLHTNVTNCNIPCHLEGCKKELRHSMSCPIWECHNTTTTTTASTTTSTATTTTPYPGPGPTPGPGPEPTPMPTSAISILLYISLAFNLAFILIGSILFAYRRYSLRMRYQPIPEEIPLTRRVSLLSNDNRFFSVGSDSESNNEQQDITAPSNVSASTGAIPKRSTFHAVNLESSPESTPSSSLHDRFLRSTYSTFKPDNTSTTTAANKDNEKETTF